MSSPFLLHYSVGSRSGEELSVTSLCRSAHYLMIRDRCGWLILSAIGSLVLLQRDGSLVVGESVGAWFADEL